MLIKFFGKMSSSSWAKLHRHLGPNGMSSWAQMTQSSKRHEKRFQNVVNLIKGDFGNVNSMRKRFSVVQRLSHRSVEKVNDSFVVLISDCDRVWAHGDLETNNIYWAVVVAQLVER